MKKLIMSSMLACLSLYMSAVPALKNWRTVKQSDGTELRLLLVGDENFHCFKTTDGLAVVEEDGAYYYADVKGEKLIKTDWLAHETEMRNSQEQQMTATLGNETDIENMMRKAPKMQHLRSRIGSANGVYEGSKKGIIILVSFDDLDFSVDNPKELYTNLANTPGYKGATTAIGSVHDYFSAQSGGKFDLTFDVVGPYKAPKSVTYYGANSNGGDQHSRIIELLKFGCESADPEVNFQDYDWDGDGRVDQVFMLYAGQGEANGGAAYTIWPHESIIGTSPITAYYLDNVRINTYACSNELNYYNNTDGIGTICHEFSHCLGLPDFYDTSSNSGNTSANYAMGPYDVMCSGSYNGNSWRPAGYTAYEKNFCGWLDITELIDPTVVSDMKPLGDNGPAYAVYNPANRNEYFVMEHRNNTSGWDLGLSVKGLLIYHVNYTANAWNNNTVNLGNKPGMFICPADNIMSDESSRNDTYPYRNILAGKNNKEFSDNTEPADVLYNKNTDGSYLLHMKVSDITYNTSSKTVSFVFNDGIVDDIDQTISETANGGEITIYSANGTKLKTTVDLSEESLPKGIYIVKGSNSTRKIVVK